ncbi:MAG: hypothetical protein SFT68_03215 [Rickettsiaceae bacterium]|nr:hypothetical protein [Rickettsiaceae bacterium]
MTRGEICHSHSSLSFPRRWESRINISWIPFYKRMTRGQFCRSPSLTISWIPFYKGMTRHRESFPRSLSLSFPRRWESSLTISWIPFFKGMTREQICHSRVPSDCHSHEGGNPE